MFKSSMGLVALTFLS
jgi:hypothetical protein